MRIAIMGLAALLAACGDVAVPDEQPGTGPGSGPPGGSAPACTTLTATGGAPATATLGPAQLTSTPIEYCLHLDATDRGLVRVLFSARTDWRDGATTPYLLSLVQTNGDLISDGHDISVGQTETRTFHQIEWGPALGRYDVILRAASRDGGAHATPISLWFADPLE